jgi:hypothetical protein
MLLPNNNYGNKDANYQILNPHIYDKHKQNVDIEIWINLYQSDHGLSVEHITNFVEYLKNENVEFINYKDNNTTLMSSLAQELEVGHSSNMPLRCGFGYIAECIKSNIKPFIIGYALKLDDSLNKQYCEKDGTGHCHDVGAEIELIKKLHDAELIDATFCSIKDEKDLQLDETLLVSTPESVSILEKVYS